MKKSFLLFVDKTTFELIKRGEVPYTKFSHDRNMFQLAHEILRSGHLVYFTIRPNLSIMDISEVVEIKKVYPYWQYKKIQFQKKLNPNILVSVHPHELNFRNKFPRSLIVGINPALGFIEYYESYNINSYVGKSLIKSINNSLDIIVVQNKRQYELCNIFYSLISKNNKPPKTLIYPFGFVNEDKSCYRKTTRKSFGFQSSDILFINAGGVWRWTDFNNFLEAFILHVKKYKKTNFKLLIMGFRQPDNTDHGDYIRRTKYLISKNKNLLNKNIFVIEDWVKASNLIQDYLSISDIGLNLNLSSVENWQSHRVRSIEYIKHGLALFNTSGDYISSDVLPESCFLVDQPSKKSYLRMLYYIQENPKQIVNKKNHTRKISKKYNSKVITKKLILNLLTESEKKLSLIREPTCLRLVEKFKKSIFIFSLQTHEYLKNYQIYGKAYFFVKRSCISIIKKYQNLKVNPKK